MNSPQCARVALRLTLRNNSRVPTCLRMRNLAEIMHFFFGFSGNKSGLNRLEVVSIPPRAWRLAALIVVWALAIFGPESCLADKLQASSFSAVLEGKETDIVDAVEAVVNDSVIHGTYVYDRETTLNGAEVTKTSKDFRDWTGGGRVYYKVCRNALAPRNFKDSADQGTITVRYVVMTEAAERFRILIDAVYVEAAHRTVHRSDGIVESSEFKEIAERLRAIQLQAQRDAQVKARINSQIAAKQELLRRRQEEVTKLADAESSAEDLVKRIQGLRHKVEMRVATDSALVKSAPFEGAATLLSLKKSTDVVVMILTPYWLGIETADGHHGWVGKEQLVPLP
jgi:hypothetical protein